MQCTDLDVDNDICTTIVACHTPSRVLYIPLFFGPRGLLFREDFDLVRTNLSDDFFNPPWAIWVYRRNAIVCCI